MRYLVRTIIAAMLAILRIERILLKMADDTQQLFTAIDSLRDAVTSAAARNDAQVVAFTTITQKWADAATTLQAQLAAALAAGTPVTTDHTAAIQELVQSITAVNSIGLTDLPDSLKKPPTITSDSPATPTPVDPVVVPTPAVEPTPTPTPTPADPIVVPESGAPTPVVP